MSDNLELDGRRALVTGGTKGIGEAVAARLAKGRNLSKMPQGCSWVEHEPHPALTHKAGAPVSSFWTKIGLIGATVKIDGNCRKGNSVRSPRLQAKPYFSVRR